MRVLVPVALLNTKGSLLLVDSMSVGNTVEKIPGEDSSRCSLGSACMQTTKDRVNNSKVNFGKVMIK